MWAQRLSLNVAASAAAACSSPRMAIFPLVLFSIDTFLPVAEACLDAGADCINDVSGGLGIRRCGSW